MVKKSLTIFALVGLACCFGSCKKFRKTPTVDAGGQPAQKPAAAIAAAPTPKPKPAFQLDQSSRVIVLCYHRIVPTIKRPDTEITPAAFEEQMKKLKEAGITVIPMQDFLAWRRGEKNIPAKSAVITLDDGWKSQYEIGWPILKKFDYPFTLFIYPGFVKGGHYSGGESLSWEQLGELRDAGADIQGHSYSHQNLKLKPKSTGAKNAIFAQFATYEDWLKYELIDSKKLIEEKLAVKVNTLAVPYGLYNQQVKDMATKAGYEAVFTVNPIVNNFGTAMDALGRYAIEANKPQTFAQAISFPGSASTAFAATAIAPSSSSTMEPADGSTIADQKPTIKADISGLGDVDGKSVEVRISGFGLVPAKFDAATRTVTCQMNQKLRDGSYTVIVSAKVGPRKVETRWSFTVDSKAKATAKPATKAPAVDVVGS